jgi:hypothetical protein
MLPKKHRWGGHAARKPTVDELLATRDRMNRASADFIKIDVETALTFAKIARDADNATRRTRNQRAARKAYDTILKLLSKVDWTAEDGRVVEKGLDRLKAELKMLGEIF